MIEAEIRFVRPVEWISELAENNSSTVRIRDVRNGRGGVMDLVDIFLPDGHGSLPTKGLPVGLQNGSDRVKIIDQNRITAIIDAHNCPVCSAIVRFDIFLIDARSHPSGDVSMVFLSPDEQTLSEFLGCLKGDGMSYIIVRKSDIDIKPQITARQEFILKTALELGYFDYPKRIDLKGLSERLGISYTTISEILRRAERKIIGEFFSRDL
ncbi:MAG: helix-turn-helix domain-containing protein [Candidatus Thermoplasmatota archaeon]|nr:helix-turn-helix domain-containing protein [Candidatus Thermoplasmatota archaeon]MCL5732500.1 helix-turn-helix domain-containing protein [Candidatus Thermoplasmatota archaeon]